MTKRPDHQSKAVINPMAAILAWLWPGLGQISRGERKRGLLIMTGILLLFFSGLLVGGLDCVDRKNDGLWFLAQGLCGPLAFGADIANQAFVQRPDDDWPQDDDLRARYLEGDPELIESLRRFSLGHVNEMGTLFIALGGLMNLVVILDAFYTTVDRDTGAVLRGGSVMLIAAYIPFLHPINALQDWSYLLLVPLAFGISIVYKSLRMPDLAAFWRHVLIMTAQIVLTMIGLAIALAVLVQVVIPALPMR